MQPLELFHPQVKKWFLEKIGTPTGIQSSVWPLIAENRHVLACAPTGSGKTLAAFLWGIDCLITGKWPAGSVRMLYISPLKALNNDVRRNLIAPLSELESCFAAAGIPFPAIRVLTRSGDTPGDERQKMLRRPPEILITTPESLNIMLTSAKGSRLLTGLSCVILDEIHAVIGTKRGTHLITAIERLSRNGEFQRIALSATVRPPEAVAEFVGGYIRTGDDAYQPRRVSIIRSEDEKKYEIRVHYPAEYLYPPDTNIPLDVKKDGIASGGIHSYGISSEESWWAALTTDFRRIIKSCNSTLFFSNSRRMAEKITRLINETEPEELAYAHHGSLSREIRFAVEEKLKQGELKAIVATSSLELGIDIGKLDQVVLIETPGSVSSAIQRIGRSGHDVGGTSRGALYPLHGMDFVNAAVMARSVLSHDIEEIHPVRAPLDVLAQVILSMTVAEDWDIDELYSFILTISPYRGLQRKYFDLVLEMLSGRFADSRIKELKPRLYVDRVENIVRAREGAAFLLYLSGGTIPDRGYFNLRLIDSKAKIGELDEEFVWERRLGETFALGSQVWRIERITHNDVEVTLSKDRLNIIPFWKAEEQNRSFYLSEKIAEFLEEADSRVEDADFASGLEKDYCMQAEAASALAEFLKKQKDATGAPLPHRHHLLIEHYDDPFNRSDKKQVILHTLWGGRVNMPFAFALSRVWEEAYHYPLEVIHTNDAVMLMLPHAFRAEEIFSMVNSGNLEKLLQRELENTGFFGARFRENAERSLLLTRSAFRRRVPLWLNRLRSKKLLDAVRRCSGFPVVIETWRSCIEDELDLINLKSILDELRDGQIKISEAITHIASPFAEGLIWKQTNKYMYEDDTPAKKDTEAGDDIRELMQSSHLRPRIPEELTRTLDTKLKRTAPGYTPGSAHELLDWIKERLLIPAGEWQDLLNAIDRDYPGESTRFREGIINKIISIELTGAKEPLTAAIEMLPRIAQAFPGLNERKLYEIKHLISGEDNAWSLADFLGQWLSYYCPIPEQEVINILGLNRDDFYTASGELSESGIALTGQFRESGISEEICYSENLEILLRMLRKSRRVWSPMPAEKLGLFLAAFQGITPRGESMEDIQTRIEQLFGWGAPAPAWEEYLLPARMEPYFNAWLDSLTQTGLTWFGCGTRKLGLAFQQDLDMFVPYNKDKSGVESLLPDPHRRYSFFDIVKASGLSTRDASERIWALAWKGLIANDSFHAVRRGIQNSFAPEEADARANAGRRSGFNRWKAASPMQGYWHRIDPEEKKDGIEKEEIIKDRVRQLFRRYGILFRELLSRELPQFQWKNVFRSLRLMEFSGEILAGHFFEGIHGLQFMSHEAFRMLRKPLPEEAVFWINAADPASLCGIDIEEIKSKLPTRLSSTFLVYEGSRVVLVAKRIGKMLEINVPHDHPRLREYFGLFKDLVSREFNPVPRITVEKINGIPAHTSNYADAMRTEGFRSSGVAMELWL